VTRMFRHPLPLVVLVALGWTAWHSPAISRAHPSTDSGWPERAEGQAPAIDAALFSRLDLRNLGPANMSGRVVDLAVDESDPSTFYVATATGGLWKTRDNGVTFAPVFFNEAVHSIGAVTVSPLDPSIVWVGTGERANRQSSGWGDGVYKSTDAGKTWTNMGLKDTHHVGRIVLHPTNPDIVYVAGMGHLWGPNKIRGLFKTVDGGKVWAPILQVDELTGVVDVAMDPSNPNILYAASYQRQRQAFGFHGGGQGSALWKTTDAGKTWNKLAAGLPKGDLGRIGISIYRKDPRIVYACIEQGLRYNASTEYGEYLAGVFRSEDKGETWTQMSTWNPRPMYASQILVDPNDDKRVYMVNAYSFSDDGGKTFTAPRQSLHGDDRIVWVDPKNSNHVMKGDDGGLGISYDRGLKWLYVTSLPVSQFYRIGVDRRKPFWICGGLQDNGSWCGPSATYSSQGILNEDWFRVGGGDGFFNLIDPTDPRTVYSASQFLGLTRVDVQSGEVADIRPGDPRGHIADRRNWATWGQPNATAPVLGNAMEPANWDAPFIISPHDPKVLYAGMRHVWKSVDRGATWTSLVDPTTGVDRSTLWIMDQKPGPTTHSLDDGVPYFPTTTALAESPMTAGLLWAGTDDGNLQVSRDGGRIWSNVVGNIPGLPKRSWVSGIEPSRYADGTVYAAFDNHASDDYGNYLFKSTDYGKSWTSIAGDLPAERVVKSVHEDPKNPNLTYIGTEFGFYLTYDGGQHWIQLKANLPTVPVNDFVIHPRDNDLVLATHGRGLWILENIASLQGLTSEVLASDAHLFPIEPAQMIRYSNPKAHQGDMIFRGQNPPAGAIVDYYLKADGAAPTLTIHDAGGNQVRRIDAPAARGINRVIWDLRHKPFATAMQGQSGRPGPRLDGPFVVPGEYVVRLATGGRSLEQRLRVEDDPRLTVAPADRRAWTDALLSLGRLYQESDTLLERARTAAEPVVKSGTAPASLKAEAEDALSTAAELRNRVSTLSREIAAFTGPITADQRSRIEYYPTVLKELEQRVAKLLSR
jgi:photosystem II stability/assembly factor-like uncharacterized protein